MSTVSIVMPDGQTLTSAVTIDAIKELEIEVGVPVEALVKSTDISLATGDVAGLSIRNQIRGRLVDLDTGSAMAIAHVAVGDEIHLTAAITRAAADELGLEPGAPVIALIKSTEVSLSAV